MKIAEVVWNQLTDEEKQLVKQAAAAEEPINCQSMCGHRCDRCLLAHKIFDLEVEHDCL